MPHWPIPKGNRPIDLDLSRILEALEVLGNPHTKLPPVFHIAGTNGKGSTLSFMQAMLEAAGYKVHKYSSPHLTDFNERIVLAGEQISDDMLFHYAEECRIAIDHIPVTFFEGTTALAFKAFSEIDADIVLLETGLGGRLDATNVIDKPLLTAITTVGLDHMEYLGPTVTTIAGEKAGIMKSHVPCVIGHQLPEGLEVLEQVAAQKQVPMFRYSHEWRTERVKDGFLYKEHEGVMQCPAPSLKGPHQVLNAAMAVACVECLDGFDVSEEAVAHGLQHTYWPARMEHIKRGKIIDILPESSEVWLDGAHNEMGSQMLAYTIDELIELDENQRDLYVILGMTKGRDIKVFLEPLHTKITAVYGVRVESEPSAYTSHYIAQQSKEEGLTSFASDNLEDALVSIANQAGDRPVRVLICGSLYLAGDVKIYNK